MKMEKMFTSLRSFTDTRHNGKLKYCISCSNLATVEALFSAGDGVTESSVITQITINPSSKSFV